MVKEFAKLSLRHISERKLEEVEYWRKRAGWFDDDESMKEFNSGVYDTYYQVDDDTVRLSGSTETGGTKSGGFFQGSPLGLVLKIGAIILAIVLSVLIFRATQRRSSSSGTTSTSRRERSDGSSRRSRSKSASGSVSRSRSRKSKDYELMDDDDGRSRKSTKSSRSRSRSRRSRSRGSSRTRSKSRTEAKEVLV